MAFFRQWWWLLLVLLLAVGLRFWRLGQIPVGLYWDEVAMLVDARSVAATGRDMHGRPWYQVLYPSYGDYKQPVYLWLASASVWAFGANNGALRLPSALAGIVSVGLIAWLSYRLTTQKEVALFSALVMALSPWGLMFSRTAFEGHVAQMLVLASVVCMVEAEFRNTKAWIWQLVAVVLGGVATYTYFSVRFVWPVVWVGYQFLGLKVWKTKPRSALVRATVQNLTLRIGLPLVLFAALLLPMVNSPLYGDSNRFRLGTDSVLKNEPEILLSNQYREWAGNTRLDRLLFHRTWLTALNLFENYSDNMSPVFLFVTGDPNLRHGTTVFGLFILPLLPLFIWGWWGVWQRSLGLGAWLAVWWLVALLPASVPEGTPHALRSLNALAPLVLVLGVGLARAARRLGTVGYTFGWAKNVGWVIVCGVLLAAHLPFWHHYTHFYPIDSAPAWQGGFQEVAQEIYQQKNDQIPAFILSFDDKFYLWLLAYGPTPPAQWQTWPTTGYQFQELPGITWHGLPAKLPPQIVLAGKSAAVETEVATRGLSVIEQKTIAVPGAEVYQVVTVATGK